MQGIQVTTTARVGSFGRDNSSDVIKFSFTKEQPLIGIYGYSGVKEISGISVI